MNAIRIIKFLMGSFLLTAAVGFNYDTYLLLLDPLPWPEWLKLILILMLMVVLPLVAIDQFFSHLPKYQKSKWTSTWLVLASSTLCFLIPVIIDAAVVWGGYIHKADTKAALSFVPSNHYVQMEKEEVLLSQKRLDKLISLKGQKHFCTSEGCEIVDGKRPHTHSGKLTAFGRELREKYEAEIRYGEDQILALKKEALSAHESLVKRKANSFLGVNFALQLFVFLIHFFAFSVAWEKREKSGEGKKEKEFLIQDQKDRGKKPEDSLYPRFERKREKLSENLEMDFSPKYSRPISSNNSLPEKKTRKRKKVIGRPVKEKEVYEAINSLRGEGKKLTIVDVAKRAQVDKKTAKRWLEVWVQNPG